MHCPLLTRALILSLLFCGSVPALAQTATPDAGTDFKAMQQKADGNETLLSFLSMVNRYRAQPEGREQIKQFLLERGGGRVDFSRPIDLMGAINIDKAQLRGQFAGQILAADLNGDWEITLKELRSVLMIDQNNGAAEAFILADANNDAILSSDEIKSAVEARVATHSNRRGDYKEALVLFDFDDDGQLTVEEFERGLVALLN